MEKLCCEKLKAGPVLWHNKLSLCLGVSSNITIGSSPSSSTSSLRSGKAGKDCPKPWAPTFTWETQVQSPCFELV